METLELAKSLGWIVPWTLLASIGAGMLNTMTKFFCLNFFSQRYTDLSPHEIHCELSEAPMHCQMALTDWNRLLTVLAIATPLCQFVAMPLVGVFSDAYGRRRTLICTYLLNNLSVIFLDLFVFYDLSLWPAIAWQPFLNGHLVRTVLNSACIDLLKPQKRAAGMGMILALDTVAYLLGILLGSQLHLKQICATTTGLTLLASIFAYIFFPETLVPERRHFQLAWKDLVPWDPLPILWRSRTLWNLAMLTALSALIDLSSARLMGIYLQRRMTWSAQDDYAMALVACLSRIFWMSVIFSSVVSYAGEVGAMAFGRLMSTAYVLVGLVAVQPAQAVGALALCEGPMAFALPAVAAWKSRLVGEEEQGRMQAAISTVYTVSAGLGSLLGGLVVEALGEAGHARAPLGAAMVAVTVLGFAGCGLLFRELLPQKKDLERGPEDYGSLR